MAALAAYHGAVESFKRVFALRNAMAMLDWDRAAMMPSSCLSPGLPATHATCRAAKLALGGNDMRNLNTMPPYAGQGPRASSSMKSPPRGRGQGGY